MCVGGVVTVVVPPSGCRFRLFVFCVVSLCCLLCLFRSVLASSERGESCTTPFKTRFLALFFFFFFLPWTHLPSFSRVCVAVFVRVACTVTTTMVRLWILFFAGDPCGSDGGSFCVFRVFFVRLVLFF